MKIIITIEGGMLTGVYADSADVSVELLDYDNYACADEEERGDYEDIECRLQAGIEAGKLVQRW